MSPGALPGTRECDYACEGVLHREELSVEDRLILDALGATWERNACTGFYSRWFSTLHVFARSRGLPSFASAEAHNCLTIISLLRTRTPVLVAVPAFRRSANEGRSHSDRYQALSGVQM